MVRYSYPELSYEMGSKYEKEAEVMHAQLMPLHYQCHQLLGRRLSMRPVIHHPSLSMAEVLPMVNPLFHPMYPLGPRMDHPSSREPPSLPHPNPEFPHPTNGAIPLVRPKNRQSARDESPCTADRIRRFGKEQPPGQARWSRAQDEIQPGVWPGRGRQGNQCRPHRRQGRRPRLQPRRPGDEGVPVRTLPHPVPGPRHVHHPHGLPRLQRPTRVQHLRPLQQRSLRVLLAHRPRRTHLSLRIPRTLAVSLLPKHYVSTDRQIQWVRKVFRPP